MPLLPAPHGRTQSQVRIVVIAVALLILLMFSRGIAGFIVDYFWWTEMAQIPTWVRMLGYQWLPGFAAWIIFFGVFWMAHARGLKRAGTALSEHRVYAALSSLALAFIALIAVGAVIDGWTVARFFGGEGAVSTWHDPVFGRPLTFYLFDLPLYSMLVTALATVTLIGVIIHYLTARVWQLRRDWSGFGARMEFDLNDLRALGPLESNVLRTLGVVFLIALAVNFYLGRYDMLLTDHGTLMVGIDYVQEWIGLGLQWALVGAAILAAILVGIGRPKLALACLIVLPVDWALPPLVTSLHVRPNELALERPYIQRHIEATRSAFGLDHRESESEFDARREGHIDVAKNRLMLDNVRLWDWHAFHDTLSQSQPLRPYTYADTDVDRYQIGGQMRQVLLAPREMDLSQLGGAGTSWINRNLVFTHGYGLVLAEANRITPSGLPELLIKNAPVEVSTPSLKLTVPQIYYGETSHEPVFVHTSQREFDYPALTSAAGASDVTITYDGHGGFPMGGFARRAVASLSEGDPNILLTGALSDDSRMMIRRRVTERVSTLANFVSWDSDPYLVITDAGRLVWIIDGYLTTDAYPYSRSVDEEGLGTFNYIRNSIKATVDAYDGDTRLYVFDREDPLVQAYQRLFPDLLLPASAMPADLRAHTRAPEMMFRAQAEIYETYHMRDPESFYNRADLWERATFTTGQGGSPAPVDPTYLVLTVPGESQPEFVLMVPFTPRNKQNLIGLMITRCDGPHLGEIVFLELPKQEVIPGPLQVEALINQDSTISKDLSLWNQQGSQVLRDQILALPIDNTFLYVAPIYIQAAQARMPQLRKVVLAMGSTLIYTDTYDEALEQLDAMMKGGGPPSQTSATGAAPAATAVTTTTPASSPSGAAGTAPDARISEIRSHLDRYRQLTAQGKLAEAGKELEAIDAIVKK